MDKLYGGWSRIITTPVVRWWPSVAGNESVRVEKQSYVSEQSHDSEESSCGWSRMLTMPKVKWWPSAAGDESGKVEKPSDSDEQLHNSEESSGGWKKPVVVAAVGTVAAVGAVVAAPAVLGAVGYTAAGIAAKSVAAGMMSSAAIANGGAIAAGSTVAVLQSIAAAGLGTAGTAVVGGVAGSVGAAVSGLCMGISDQKSDGTVSTMKSDGDEKSTDFKPVQETGGFANSINFTDSYENLTQLAKTKLSSVRQAIGSKL